MLRNKKASEKLSKVENRPLLWYIVETMEEKFVLCSVEGQVLKVAYLGSGSVLLEMPIYQYNFTCGKITMLILVIKFTKYEIVL